MTADLAGSVSLVTGGNSGIGHATAARLAANGAHVIVTRRDTTRGDQAVERIRSAGGKADYVAASPAGDKWCLRASTCRRMPVPVFTSAGETRER